VLPDWLASWIGQLQGWLFQTLALPFIERAGLSIYVDDAFDGTETLLLGALEVAALAAVLVPLQRLMPLERPDHAVSPGSDQRADVIYTLIHRLGLVPLAMFFALRPLFDGLQAWLRMHGFATWDLETWLPGLADHPVAAFLVYLLVIDLVQYWIHRWQHRWDWWWALHALHHSQRRMTFWTDDRTHLLDDLITHAILASVALAIGVAPAQYAAIAIGTRTLESLSHANVRLWFGPLGERLLVSPRFHRLHHAMKADGRDHVRGANFAVLFPVWDLLFGTADFDREPGPTGIDDQLAGRRYGDGFWSQQWLGLQRLAVALWPGRANGAHRPRTATQAPCPDPPRTSSGR